MNRPRRTTLITIAAAVFLIGLWLGRSFSVSIWVPIVGLILVLIARKRRLLLPILIFTALTLGVWRGHETALQGLSLQSQIGNKVTIVGKIIDDPSVSDAGFVYFSIKQPKGNIKVLGRNSHLQKGYLVRVTGKLQPGFGAHPVQMGFAQTEVLSTGQSGLERLRQRFLAGMRTALPEPLSGFALGLLVGTRALIPKTLQGQLNAVGLSHLVAVSGYNLTIIVKAVQRLAGKRSKFIAAAIAAWAIFAFMLIAGFSPAIVRAAVVSGLSIVAAYYGREFKPHVLIGLAAALTAALNPNYLLDLGWQLSFLAFYGIIVLAPAISARFNITNIVGLLVVESLCAQLLTLPLLALTFERMSIISPLANVLVLPLVPLAMTLSLMAGVAGMFAPGPIGLFVLPAQILMQAITTAVERLAAINWAQTKIQMTATTTVAIYIVTLAGSLLLVRSKQRQVKTDII